MGQKVNPHGLRVGVIKDWNSKWYAEADFADYLVDGKVDYSRSRNLVLTSVVLVTGLSGIALKIGNVEMTGMVLACVVAMAMSLVFYILDKFGLTNDQPQK